MFYTDLICTWHGPNIMSVTDGTQTSCRLRTEQTQTNVAIASFAPCYYLFFATTAAVMSMSFYCKLIMLLFQYNFYVVVMHALNKFIIPYVERHYVATIIYCYNTKCFITYIYMSLLLHHESSIVKLLWSHYFDVDALKIRPWWHSSILWLPSIS